MEFLTLSFKNEDYENLYREQIHKKELNLFVSTIKGVIMVGMIGVSVSIVYGNLFNLLIWLGIMIIILLAYFYSRKSYEVMDYAAMFMSLTLNVYMQYLFLNKNFFADTKTILQNYYTIGQLLGILQISLFVGTRFYIKIIPFIQNMITIYIILSIENSNLIDEVRAGFLFGCFSIILYLYKIEKNKRTSFMIYQQNEQWERGVDQGLDAAILQCTYDYQTNQIILKKQNKKSITSFQAEDESQFKQLIRNIYNSKSFQYQHIMTQNITSYNLEKLRIKKFRMNLEKFLYFLFTQPKKIQKICDYSKFKSIYHSYIYFSGVYQNKCLKITIFPYYDENPFSVIMIDIKEEKEQLLCKEYKINVLKQLVEKQSIAIQQKLKVALVGQQFQKLKYSKTEKIKYFQIRKLIEYNQYQILNTQLNIQCYLHTIKQSIRTTQFNLDEQIEYVIRKVQIEANKRKIQILKNYQKSNFKVITCKWMITQIVFNLLNNAIKYSPNKTVIEINIRRQFHKTLNCYIYKLSFFDEAPFFSQKEIDKLPVINPYRITDLVMNEKQKDIQLGLVVSQQLLSIIGPYQQMKLVDHNIKKEISFIIFQDMNNCQKNQFYLNQKVAFKFKVKDQQDVNINNDQYLNNCILMSNRSKDKIPLNY